MSGTALRGLGYLEYRDELRLARALASGARRSELARAYSVSVRTVYRYRCRALARAASIEQLEALVRGGKR